MAFKITGNQKKKQKKKPFAAIELETILSDQWKQLKASEGWVYTILKTFYTGEGKSFKAPFADIKRRSGIKHGETIDRAIQGHLVAQVYFIGAFAFILGGRYAFDNGFKIESILDHIIALVLIVKAIQYILLHRKLKKVE